MNKISPAKIIEQRSHIVPGAHHPHPPYLLPTNLPGPQANSR